MPPLPPYLIFITLFLVVIPSIVTLFLRISLYRYLIVLTNKVQRLIKSGVRGEQPKIVQTLEARFQQASKQLEQVNTGALIDQVYSQEKINRFTCEQIDYLCRILPNLLLSFGLMGTFLGITINLSTLSQTINHTNASDVSNLVSELNKPLEGMSIAFTTSLTGLFFSALLTVVNFIFNSGLAKYRLISSLEDYLDNIYLPEVQGDTRLDKIVNRMVSQQDEFLTNFGKVVREAVEQSMGKVAQQIADGNKETTDLAKQVYERFAEAAGTISRAADDFENSMTELKSTSQIFKESAETFNQSQFPLHLSLATVDLSNTQQKFSESATSLAATTELIITALIGVENCSQSLINLGEEIKGINQSSMQVLDLHQTNQNLLSEIIPQLHQGAKSYEKAVNKLDKSDKKVAEKLNSLDELITGINQLLETVKEYTAEINFTIASVSNQIDGNNQQIQTFFSNIEGYVHQFNVEFAKKQLDLLKLLQNNNSLLISEYQTVNNTMIQGINKQTGVNTKGFQVVIAHLQECNKNIYDTKNSIVRLKQGVE
ncbi:hypothetical protein PN465_01080 [Nodularia spumigena CS-584]|uniref:hypothetical protein n=1 Tax=Nodularia spumigena TaxID=70799 RepID=UPI0000EAA381|nr:hypothetical protein [Nodularia spumigena]AHJ27455.1 interaptin [Nodularia spumigena CCY9414]EAW46027.1 hypothetical protein N9414_10348 [Nodularia spumigena CCY9414]MDB9380838.1 hypothetical protein [Nodularia spumigena CS-584]MEA5557207.1 hypothetical protein [Nodularia spumigena CH309]